jgi:hypothetical protein
MEEKDVQRLLYGMGHAISRVNIFAAKEPKTEEEIYEEFLKLTPPQYTINKDRFCQVLDIAHSCGFFVLSTDAKRVKRYLWVDWRHPIEG